MPWVAHRRPVPVGDPAGDGRVGRDAEAAAARRGLVLAPTDDPFTGGTGGAERISERLGAQFRALDGLGHWWMLADPGRGARVLQEFWASI